MDIEHSRFQDIVRFIKRDIFVGKIKPLEKLPSERKLSEKYEVGRGTIREALKAIEAIGLVNVISGRKGGYFINEKAPEISEKALYSSIKLEDAFIGDSLVFRRMLEPKTCFYAAKKRTNKNLRELQHSIRKMEKGAQDPNIYAESNFDFHYEIAKASGNPFIIGTYQYVVQMMMETAKMVHSVPTLIGVTEYFHKEIYKSIKNRDAERAEFMMDAHLATVPNYIQERKELKVKK
jgi:GntR family transcriptional regulator, transcriptional repressor for pyruvate dehydrogenase complex